MVSEKNILLCYLKALMESSNKKDQSSLNNIVYLAHFFSMFKEYNDFKGFGKLGVSSSNLGWHYNLLNDEWDSIKENNNLESIREFGQLFATLTTEELGLIACWKFDSEFLNLDEREVAKNLFSTQIENKVVARS